MAFVFSCSFLATEVYFGCITIFLIPFSSSEAKTSRGFYLANDGRSFKGYWADSMIHGMGRYVAELSAAPLRRLVLKRGPTF